MGKRKKDSLFELIFNSILIFVLAPHAFSFNRNDRYSPEAIFMPFQMNVYAWLCVISNIDLKTITIPNITMATTRVFVSVSLVL